MEEVKQIIKMLGQVSLAHYQLLPAQALVRITVQVVVQVVVQVLALAVHQVHHHLHNQIVEDKKVVLIATFFFFPFVLQ